MISFNPKKVMDFVWVITSAFFVAMAGNFFFGWDIQFSLIVGLILGVWSTLYDICVEIVLLLNGESDEDEEEAEKKE